MATATRAAAKKTPSRKAPAPGRTAVGKPAAETGRKSQQPAKKAEQPVASVAAVQADTARSARPKQKLVRDSFTMPKQDFALIDLLKDRMVAYRRPTKKSELLRAGLHALMALPDADLGAALDGIAPLKPGRPKKDA